jgi:ABC-2 type transport system permease protein
MLTRTGLSAESLATILAPVSASVTYAEGSDAERGGERWALIIVVSVMLMALFIGMSYVFASITGEKQIRVTEQVVSAISPQAWIDGKLLGLLAVSIVGVVAQIIAFGVIYLVMRQLDESSPISLPATAGHPGIIALIVLFAILGLFFWFAFLAALAATIDDPQHSARGSFLFVPLFASGMAFLMLGNPDSGFSRALALFPPTAPSAMPVRLLATDVSVVEVALSIGLLVAATIMLRMAAGRIFSAAMMMYGKEPSWAEMRRWMGGAGG